MRTRTKYLPGLDVIRLTAMLPVVCYHFTIESARAGYAVPGWLIGRPMADVVELALVLFFLLSGASLCWQWRGRFAWRPYLAGRAAGVYPMYWLGWGTLFLYGEILHGNNAEIPRWRAIFSLLGLDGYLLPVTATFYKIGEWFLGVILLLYLVFPLLLWCVETPRRRALLAAAMTALALVWPLVCPAPLESGHTVLGRLPAFALGVWFGTELSEPKRSCLWGLAAVTLLAFAPRTLWPVVYLLVGASLFWLLLKAGGNLPEIFHPAMRWLAEQCYGIYLVHHVFLTLVVLPLTARFSLPLVAVFPVYLTVCVAGAAVLSALAAPLSRLLKRKLS